MKKAFISGLFILCLYLLQSTLFAMFSIGGIRPNLLIIATASLGFLGGKRTGIYAGFFSGIFCRIPAWRPTWFSCSKEFRQMPKKHSVSADRCHPRRNDRFRDGNPAHTQARARDLGRRDDLHGSIYAYSRRCGMLRRIL